MPSILQPPAAFKASQIVFEPISRVRIARSRGRAVAAESDPYAYWQASITSPALTDAEYGELSAFLMQIRAGGDFVAMHDFGRPRPIEYAGAALSGDKAIGGAFDGSCTIDAIADSRSVTLSGLPDGFKFKVGDYLEFRESLERRSLHKITASAEANSGGVVDLNFEHALDLENFTIAGAVQLEQPGVLMQVFEKPSLNQSTASKQISFSLQEVAR